MNSGVQRDDQYEQAPAGGLAVGDILFTLFRHKLIIIVSVVLGIAAAGIVRVIKPPNFESTAKVYIPYVVDIKVVKTAESEAVVNSSEAVMNTEVEMLKSFDTALDVATNIGPAKILAKYGGGSDRLQAAGVVSGLCCPTTICMANSPSLHFTRGRIKLEIGLAKGKKMHDKRQDEHEKDWKREAQRAMKERQR